MVSDLDPKATIRPPFYDCPLTQGLLLCPFSYFGPFLVLKLFGGDNFALLNHVFTLLFLFAFLVCKLRWRSMDGKRSWRSGLDSHLGLRPSYVRLEELKQARLWLPL